jgi:hypothetical protein
MMLTIRRFVGTVAIVGALVVPAGNLPAAAVVAPAQATIAGRPAIASSPSATGFLLLYGDGGSQLAISGKTPGLVAEACRREEIDVALSIPPPGRARSVRAEVSTTGPGAAEVRLAAAGTAHWQSLRAGHPLQLEAAIGAGGSGGTVHLGMRAGQDPMAIRWRNLRLAVDGREISLAVSAAPGDPRQFPPPALPPLRPAIEEALIEWDWRMQDGIGTDRAPSTYAAAIERTLDRGDKLLADLRSAGLALDGQSAQWRSMRGRWQRLVAAGSSQSGPGQTLWQEVHALRRRLVLANPLARTGPLVFVKQAPSVFSHELTQYTGNCARPGGGVFVLSEPGKSLGCRELTSRLPVGCYQFADVSYDGRRVLFAFCEVDRAPPDRQTHLDKFFHLYEAAADGSWIRRLTAARADDFAPRYLPDGQVVFISTRRGGFHRCGQGPCPVHTLARCGADGSHPHPISFHETHEWDPSVLGDGRVLYTRWDYIDRDAVHYQQLWTVRPDGSAVAIYYGNNTFNPVGVWEARPVPGSPRVMATAAPHHAMTAGSVILLDVRRGIDGLAPLTRLTPDAPFPESETAMPPAGWHSRAAGPAPPVPVEAVRWPGHCYKSPQPLSEKYFLAAYSFDGLVGEPAANPANMFGLYLVDAFGNKELLYRDLNLSSLWPSRLAARTEPPALPAVAEAAGPCEGAFLLQDVHRSLPQVPPGSVKRLRILQVLPKTTWHANQPTVGLAFASPGKQVLGTVPVEPDGSAWFRAPAGIPLAFQALDANGEAVQIMRSLTYLQPGETASCTGCHEPRNTTPPPQRSAVMALARGPSAIGPGPDGSNPLCYPILVQPVLDRRCLGCHNPRKSEGKLILTGQPEGRYTVSYNALAPRVPYSQWWTGPGDFRAANSEPLTTPGFFGAKASSVMTLLHRGHHQVALSREDYERLATWMDANALFYGTFDPADQARQQRGERIAGPKLE